MLLSAASAGAEEGAWTLSHLTAGLALESPETVRFSEERRLQYLTEPLFLEGTLSYAPPGRLEKLVLRPKWERMIVDGDLLTIEHSPKKPPIRVLLSDHPTLAALITALRAVLAGDQGALEHIYATALEGTEDSWLLRLTPRSRKLREAVSEVHIAGSASRIGTIEIREAGGDRSIFTIRGKT